MCVSGNLRQTLSQHSVETSFLPAAELPPGRRDVVDTVDGLEEDGVDLMGVGDFLEWLPSKLASFFPIQAGVFSPSREENHSVPDIENNSISAGKV